MFSLILPKGSGFRAINEILGRPPKAVLRGLQADMVSSNEIQQTRFVHTIVVAFVALSALQSNPQRHQIHADELQDT